MGYKTKKSNCYTKFLVQLLEVVTGTLHIDPL